jgi:hypothetical protein
MSDPKPWTASGLTSEARALAVANAANPNGFTTGDLVHVREALDAAARDAHAAGLEEMAADAERETLRSSNDDGGASRTSALLFFAERLRARARSARGGP